MPSLIPKHVKKEITDVWVAETWKIMLLSATHTPNASTQQYVSDVSANAIAASGPYPLAGIACGGALKTSVEHIPVAGQYNYFLDCPDIAIGPAATLNYRYGVLFQDTGNPATSKIRAQIDFLTNQIVVNGTSTIKWNALGIIYVS